MNSQSLTRCRGSASGFVLLLSALVVQDIRAQEGYWDSRFWIPEFSVPARMAMDSSGRLILAGNKLGIFIPDQISLGRWDGRRWETLATNAGVLNVVGALTNEVLIGGRFSRVDGVAATNIARFDGIHWQSFGDGLPGAVFALAGDASSVIAGGDFASATNSTLTNIARWDGQQWQNIGGGVPGRVLSIAVATNGNIYAASDGVSDQVPASVWHWNGQDWTQIGDFGNAGARRVRRLAWISNTLFAALAPANSNDCVVQWQGSQWIPAGDVSLSGAAEVLAFGETGLVAGGTLNWVRDGETNRAGIARLTNGRWVADLADETLSALDFVTAGREAYALGLINDGISDRTARGVWHSDGRSWGQLNNGLRYMNECYRIAEAGPRVVVTGVPSRQELRVGLVWDGRQWLRLGVSPPAGSALTIQTELGKSGTNLFANARLGMTNTVGILARLDGTNWVQATEPFPLTVTAISGDGRNVFAAGRISTSNGSFGTVWEWDGSTWQQLGGLFSGRSTVQAPLITSLVHVDGMLFAAGGFTNIDGAPRVYFARWDGQNWESPGELLDGLIMALSADGKDIYAAGAFAAAGATTLNRVGLFKNGQWNALGNGVGLSTATAVAARDGRVVAVGGSRAGQLEVWLWRGGSWTLAGSGASSFSINHMLWRGNDLHVAGGFTTMGGYVSDTYAIWHEAPALAEAVGYGPSGFELQLSGALPTRFEVQRSLDLQSWESIATNTPANPAERFRDSAASSSPQGFYRVAGQP